MMTTSKLLLALFGVVALVCVAEACNEAICASRVSKCMLIKCCECQMENKKNCSCCSDCHVCLGDLYTECCSCVGMCPPPDPEMGLMKTSSVEPLLDPIPDLFNVLTEIPDPEQRWTTFTFPRHQPEETLLKYAITIGEKEKKYSPKVDEEDSNQNCTVAFFSQCLSIHKCKASCKSMGAAKYRWFHEFGCCQCVGDTCLNYGLPEPRCLTCPEEMIETEISIEEDDGMKMESISKMAVGGT